MARENQEPAARRIAVRLLGRPVAMPAGELLLRGVQFLYGDRISMGRFCWNNECGNCEVSCRLPGEETTRRIRGCQALVEEGMEILDISTDLAPFVKG